MYAGSTECAKKTFRGGSATAVVTNVKRYVTSRDGAASPGKAGLTSRHKGADLTTRHDADARRAGCIERCLSSSTEAHQSKTRPGALSEVARHGSRILVFYPMD